jgi:hypothetical protein
MLRQRTLASVMLFLWGAAACAAQAYVPDSGKPKLSVSAIQIEMTSAGDSKIPITFRYAMYEQMVDHVEKSGTFKTTYRSGDRRAKAAPDLLTLHTTVTKFREGSQTTRELTDFFGWTRVEVKAVVADQDGRTVLEKNVVGKIRFRGDNLKVTDDLGKQLAKLLRESFAATGTPLVSATK